MRPQLCQWKGFTPTNPWIVFDVLAKSLESKSNLIWLRQPQLEIPAEVSEHMSNGSLRLENGGGVQDPRSAGCPVVRDCRFARAGRGAPTKEPVIQMQVLVEAERV